MTATPSDGGVGSPGSCRCRHLPKQSPSLARRRREKGPVIGRHHIALIPGDGIGPEVIGATRTVLAALDERIRGLELRFTEALIGMSAYEETGDPLPPETVEIARDADAVLHGATDGASLPRGLPKPLRGLRMALETYANVRPATSFRGVDALHTDVDVTVVREISEGLHCHVEYPVGSDAVCSVRITTRSGTQRVAQAAFELARRRRRVLTALHKRGALPQGDGLWIETIEDVARRFPDVELDLRNVDAALHELILRPGEFDVVLAENSRGDIASDVTAALVGGLGLAASGCFGDRWSYFEPVHGTAPDIAGRGLANPAAAMLAASLLLDHRGENEASRTLHEAVSQTLAEGIHLTLDLGGSAGTEEFTSAVLRHLASD